VSDENDETLPDKPNKHYHMHIISNGVIKVRELRDDEIPKDPPFLGDPDYKADGLFCNLFSVGELAQATEKTIRGLQLIDPKEILSIGTQEQNEEMGKKMIDEDGL